MISIRMKDFQCVSGRDFRKGGMAVRYMLFPPPSRWGFKTYPLHFSGSIASLRASRPDGVSSSGKMFVNVSSRPWIEETSVLMKRLRIEGVEEEVGVARTCWTFFAPASCVRIVGHLIALERSICRRAFHADASG